MFDEMDSPFNEAFGKSPESPRPTPLRVRKTWQQTLTFWGTNLLVMPFVLVCYLTISAEGLRQMMGVFGMRLYKTPIPGAGLLRNYDGWDKLDIGSVAALLLCVSASYIWFRVFTELMGYGKFTEIRTKKPILFYLLTAFIGIMLIGDSAIFYFGLQSKAAGGWSETPFYIAPMATILYMAGLALLGAWHADYHCSGTV